MKIISKIFFIIIISKITFTCEVSVEQINENIF